MVKTSTLTSCSKSTIMTGKINTKYNKFTVISRHNDKFKERFELRLYITESVWNKQNYCQ